MKDQITTLQELKTTVKNFVDERDWAQFHAPKNLAMCIAIEAAELMEKFQWMTTQASHDETDSNRDEIEQELADVIISALCFANITGIDISDAVDRKLKHNAQKYPIEKAKGKYTKYTQL